MESLWLDGLQYAQMKVVNVGVLNVLEQTEKWISPWPNSIDAGFRGQRQSKNSPLIVGVESPSELSTIVHLAVLDAKPRTQFNGSEY